MLTYAPVKLSRIVGLANNSKKHTTSKTTASVLNHNFRDPVQVDLVFLEEQYQGLTVEEVLADDTIKLTLVEGHDRVLGVCATLFKKDREHPPGNVEVVRDDKGKVIDWLIPATIAKSENRAKAVAYSVDHNLTTFAILGDDVALSVFESDLLLEQLNELACEGEAVYGFEADFTDIAARLMDAHDDCEEEGEEGEEEGGSEEDESELEEEPEPIVKLGDIWQLGRHRLFCGDSCDVDAVQSFLAGVTPTFVWADPPYGVSIVSGGYVGGGEAYKIPFGGVKNESAEQKSKRFGSVGGSKPFGSVGGDNIIAAGSYAPIIGDDTIETATKSSAICLQLFDEAVQVWWGANYYASVLPNSQCWFVWDKNNTGNFADCELAWVSLDKAARLFKHTWNGMIKESEHGQKRVHPTQKPIALCVKGLELFSPTQGKDDIIFDPFCGSGISFLAAEQTGATVYGLELSEAYCDIIIARWEKMTGLKASKISHQDDL